jgi:hypothetical protein
MLFFFKVFGTLQESYQFKKFVEIAVGIYY